MTSKLNNPDGVHAPFGGYHHTAVIDARQQLLNIAGQVGAYPDGTIAEGFRAQAEQAFRNVLSCLEANDFTASDLVRLTIYILDRGNLEEMRAARVSVLGADVMPPSTLLVVSGLAAPEMLIEVEAQAARG